MRTALGDRMTVHSRSENKRLALLTWGQSLVLGAESQRSQLKSAGWPTGGEPLEGCYGWDKWMTDNPTTQELTDSARSGAAHQFRPLTIGWGGGPSYPWETLAEDPAVSMHQQLAYDLRRITGADIYLISLGIGGAQVTDQAFPTFNVNPTGTDSHLETLLDYHWAPAKAALLALDASLGGTTGLLGVYSQIGETDARPEYQPTYEASYGDTIDAIRTAIAGAGNEDQLPYTVGMTARHTTVAGVVLEGMDFVRAAQVAIAAARTNCESLDQNDSRDRSTAAHYTAHGFSVSGAIAARHIAELTPLALTA